MLIVLPRRHAECVASFDDARRELRGASVLVRDHLIEAIDPAAELPATADEVIDARGHLVMPGLVNTHHHMYQSLTRAIPKVQEAELFSWLSGTRSGPGLTGDGARAAGDGRAAAGRLHHQQRSSLYLSEWRAAGRQHRSGMRDRHGALDFRSWADHRLGERRPDAWAPPACA